MRGDLLLGALGLLLAATGLVQIEDSGSQEWQLWKKQFGAKWMPQEEAYRRMVFEANVLRMKEHNANPASTYQMGLNQFSALADEEFVQQYLTPMDNGKKPNRQVEHFELIGDIDWTTKGAVSPVKNQGNCGSCWAFSTTGVLESWALQTGKSVSLSEQQLVDCSGSYGNHGCNGGWPSNALNYVKAMGLSTESEYPYRAVNQNCAKQGGSFKLGSYRSSANCAALASDINTRPISVTVDATNWSRYSSGVFSNCAASINHAVLLVGVVGGNWKIKNSWGTSWGESGFIRLAAGNTCGVCAYASPYPTA